MYTFEEFELNTPATLPTATVTVDYKLVRNLAELVTAIGTECVHSIVTRVPEQLAKDYMSFRALSLFAQKVLCKQGFFALIGTLDSLPASTQIQELDFVTATPIASTNEYAFIFQLLSDPRFHVEEASIQRFYSPLRDCAELVERLITKPHELLFNPFAGELDLEAICRNHGVSHISTDASAASTSSLVASMQVLP